MRFALLATLALLVLGPIQVGAAGPYASTTCNQLNRLKSVFPQAAGLGFHLRRPISVAHQRGTLFPGRCGGFLTTYQRYKTGGASIDISVTLYKTAHAVAAPLAEPAYGPARTLANGARVRTVGPIPVSVNGSPASETGVASAYRRIFISSVSISRAKTPVPIAAQLHVHRQIEAAFRALG